MPATKQKNQWQLVSLSHPLSINSGILKKKKKDTF